SAVLVSGPAHGTLTLNASGSFTYTPEADYAGPDFFTYRASDGTASGNVATVTLTVRAAGPGVSFQPDPCDPDQLAIVVRGTSGDDRIETRRDGGSNSNRVEVTIRSATYNFTKTYERTFSRIIVHALAGDDRVTVQNALTVPAMLFGEEGNDILQAGGGP